MNRKYGTITDWNLVKKANLVHNFS